MAANSRVGSTCFSVLCCKARSQGGPKFDSVVEMPCCALCVCGHGTNKYDDIAVSRTEWPSIWASPGTLIWPHYTSRASVSTMRVMCTKDFPSPQRRLNSTFLITWLPGRRCVLDANARRRCRGRQKGTRKIQSLTRIGRVGWNWDLCVRPAKCRSRAQIAEFRVRWAFVCVCDWRRRDDLVEIDYCHRLFGEFAPCS